MQRAALCLLGLFLLCAPAAFADSLDSVTPSSFFQFDSEQIITLSGVNLLGAVGTTVVLDGPAGTFVRDIGGSSVSGGVTTLLVSVPDEALIVTGRYTVTVLSDDGSTVRSIGPGFFDVIARPVLPQPPLISVPEIVVGEAESVAGGHVTFDVAGFSFVDPPPAPAISCTHSSGDLFPLGTTPVTCTATDSFGSASGSFVVIVTDSTPPVITVPADFSTSSVVVTYTVSATDSLDGSVPVSCSPASGSTFPNGTTIVLCRANDAHLNVSFKSFTVVVSDATQPPALTLPGDLVLEATGPAGALVTYSVSATQSATISCSPASGSIFGVGVTPVSCTATAPGGTTTGSFNVVVIDTVPPVLTLPATIQAVASGPSGAVVTYAVSATDAVSGAASVTCDTPSGSTFAIGTTIVQCTAFDASFNHSEGSFNVVVAEADTTPPVVTVPANITTEATGPAGAIVTFFASATDNVDGPVPVTCSPASGTTFPLGTTTVQCTAMDAQHNIGSASFLITVRDTTPPTLSLPANITAEATGPSGASVTYTATASDLVDGARPVTCDHASGSTFPLGTTTVQCTATDTHNNTAHGSFTVTVRDTTPPQIVSITASPNSLWPPNHKMVDITVSVIATDLVDPHPVSHIISVTSNQPINGVGDGNTSPDWIITGPLTLQLRAERAGGTDRIYTIIIETTDASGNITNGTTTVTVSQSRGRAVH